VQQPLIDLSDLDATRARLRMSVRPRDRSADNILLANNPKPNNGTSSNLSSKDPLFNKSMQRSVSFKRPQEINETKLNSRPILKAKKEENNKNDVSITKPIEKDSTFIDLSTNNENNDEQINVNNSSPTQSRSRSSSQEHIYDNLDVFKRPKPFVTSSSNEDESPSTSVKTREHSTPTTRLRPVTVHASANNDNQTTNEFENVFNQLKKRGSIRRVRPNEETTSEPPPPAPVEEPPPPVPVTIPPHSQPQNEPTLLPNKPIETTPTPQTPNRRKTVGGVHLPANNKVATDDNKPAPSWIDIAKQKQNKL
jgi:hypothetical protein